MHGRSIILSNTELATIAIAHFVLGCSHLCSLIHLFQGNKEYHYAAVKVIFGYRLELESGETLFLTRISHYPRKV